MSYLTKEENLRKFYEEEFKLPGYPAWEDLNQAQRKKQLLKRLGMEILLLKH
jgi:hypothetical protein